MKIILPAALMISLTSCVTQFPISKEKPANNQTYKVEYLFEHEGCKVYRFYDRGGYVYFTNCNGTAVTSDSVKTYNSINTKKADHATP